VSDGAKALLTISRCVVDGGGNISVNKGEERFEAMINPAGYEHGFSLNYSENQIPGQPGSEAKYNTTNPETLEFKDLILDGTGTIRSINNNMLVPVKEQIKLLKEVVYSYNGKKHETPIVQVNWGSFLFYGRVKSLTFDYTLFKPNGVPLRAKVRLSFIEYKSIEEISKKANQSSPDLTHLVEVKAGDTLPLLCYQIYQDSAYYTEVARINRLTNFRELKPGTRLRFPPLS